MNTMNAVTPRVMLLALIGLRAIALPQSLDVPYVPTPMDVVETMLSIGEVDGDDVLYDLGCGDGRIVIEAARTYGAKGVGVDLDPERISDSRRNAREANVTDMVEFHQGDLFELDLSPATVVTLYLLPEVNIRLRPKLLQELQPGTHVVSHDFDMGIWRPDSTIELDNSDVYRWIIPANVSGVWQWERGRNRYEMRIDQYFQQVVAAMSGSETARTVSRATIDGDYFEMTFESDNGPVRLKGTVNGDTISGTVSNEYEGELPWRAKRLPGSAESLDPETGA